MTDLSSVVVSRIGHIEICTANEIAFKHRGDRVVLRGPLRAMIRMNRPNGKQKASEEIVLRGPGDTREVACNESDQDKYDVTITDMGALPSQPTILDMIVDRKHFDVVTSSGFSAYHQNDTIRLRGPSHYHVEYRNKQGGLRRAEDVNLNPGEFRDFTLKAADEDLVISGSIPGVAQAAPAPVMQAPAPAPVFQQPAPAPVVQAPPPVVGPPTPPGGYGPRLPDGTLIKTANLPTVYVMHGGGKRALTLEAFNRSGYRWDSIWIMPDHHLNEIPNGAPLN